MNNCVLDILLVEDSPSDVDLFMLAHKMNKSAATVRVVRDGVEAVNFLLGDENRATNARTALPRLVLLDLNMPRMNGFEVLERLRGDERAQALPVVVFSSSDEGSDEHECRRLGANDYVRKPNEFPELCKTLSRLEALWLKVK